MSLQYFNIILYLQKNKLINKSKNKFVILANTHSQEIVFIFHFLLYYHLENLHIFLVSIVEFSTLDCTNGLFLLTK